MESATAIKNDLHILGVIDPYLMEMSKSIMSNILAKMFQKFTEHIENENMPCSFDKQKKVINSFQEAFHACNTIEVGNNEDMGSLDQLSATGNATVFKSRMTKLMEEYISFMYGPRSNKRLLIIIDEFMLEENNNIVSHLHNFMDRQYSVVLYCHVGLK